MSRVRFAPAWAGALLLLALASIAEAQYPRPTGGGRTTSAVGTLFPDSVATTPAPAPTPATGALRELVCRGGEGVQMVTVANPSPRGSSYVEVSLSYRRNSTPVGGAYENLEPGACTWNLTGSTSIPAEPGIVRFDVSRQGAEYTPDPTTLTQWMGDPRHYWTFYVNDATNFSISHGAYGTRFQLAPGERTSAPRTTADRRERLRCRGGGGVTFAQGRRVGSNLFMMTLSYRVASTAAGPIGKGLEPGTCAWGDRADAPAEPGRIEFTTPRNAQRTGPVDSSATAAERYPDLRTIPAYMTDPGHYWTFSVNLTNPDSALRHEAWMPTAPEAPAPQPPPPVATTPSADGPYTSSGPGGQRTTVSLPGGVTGGTTVDNPYTPGAGSATSDVGTAAVAPLRLTSVNLILDRFTIQFSGRANQTPTVLYSTEKAVREPSTGRWFFPEGVVQGSGAVEGGFRAEVAGGTADGFRASYSAWSRLTPQRGTRYYYIVTLPAGPGVKEEQLTGEFTTLAQHVRVVFTQIGIGSTRNEDLGFRFFAQPEGGYAVSRDLGPGLEWEERYYALDGQVLDVPNAPDKLRVLVWGGDFDGVSGQLLMPQYDWDLPPKNGGVTDENIARYELTISGSKADRFITFPFILQPVYRGFLMFSVHGRVEVTRK
ncbi:MAG TPA: hypothetical protein VH764_04010 [Gemmatimonadales bacterium]